MASKYLKGITVEIGGNVGPLNNALKDVDRQSSILQNELREVEKLLKLDPTNTELLAQKQKLLGDAVASSKERLDTLKAAQEQFIASGGDVSSEAYLALQREIIKTEQDLSKLEKQSSDAADSAKDSGKQWNTAGEQIGDAGDKAGKTGKELEESGKQAEKSGEKFEKLGGVLTTVGAAMGTVAVAAGAAAVKLGKDVVEQYGELEQNLGGSEAVFGEYAASIQKIGEEAYKNLGVSQSEYLATANKMGALFQGSGVDQQRSLELTEQAMQRAADMASVMGIDMSSALEAVTGAAKGNYTMMDNLGVSMNDTNLKAFALSNGLTECWETATQAEKAEAAMQMFFQSTQQYAGNFANESTETISGSIGLLGASLESFTAGLGNADADIQNLTDNIVDAFESCVDNIVPVIENIVNALPKAMPNVLNALSRMLPTLIATVTGLFSQVLNTLLTLLPRLIPAAVDAVMTIVGALIDNLPLLINAAVTLIMALATGLGDALPELIPQAVGIILTLVENLLDNIDQLIDAALQLIMGLADGIIAALPVLIEKAPVIIQKLVDALVNNLPKIMEAAYTIIIALVQGIIQNLPELLKAALQIIGSLVSGIIKYLGNIGKAAANIVSKIWETITSTDWLQLGRDIIGGIVDGVVDAALGLVNAVKSAVSGAISAAKSLFGIEDEADLPDETGATGRKTSGTRSGYTGGTTNITINNHSPRALTEAESAKQTKRALRDLALEAY